MIVIWDEIPLAELNELNWANLFTSGIGEDYICLNESMADGKTLLDFATLYDYADYLFQEQVNKQDFENYQAWKETKNHHIRWSYRWLLLSRRLSKNH